jgi:hypothetical protein
MERLRPIGALASALMLASCGGGPPADPPPDLAAPDGAGCPPGQQLCPTTSFNDEPTSSYQCRAPIGNACPSADMEVDSDTLTDDGHGHKLQIVVESFAPMAPEVLEGCVVTDGARRLLLFNFLGINYGNESMSLGKPNMNDPTHWQYAPAHHHWHVQGWALYRLLQPSGQQAAFGHKQGFCLTDNVDVVDPPAPSYFPTENCDPSLPFDQIGDLGLSPLWGDMYDDSLPCQWNDIGPPDPTSQGYLPDGLYILRADINVLPDGTHLYRESNYDNNTATAVVKITGNQVVRCAPTTGQACDGGTVGCDGSCAP